VQEFKERSIAAITKHVTTDHLPETIALVRALAESYETLSHPLFLQATILQRLIPRVLHHAILYYARRIPEELGRFYWTVDAKQEAVTEYEHAWSFMLYGTLQAGSLESPIWLAEGGDYSYLERFRNPVDSDNPLIAEYGHSSDDLNAISIRKVLLGRLRFRGSQDSLGLQLVDILTTATRRAIKGTLGQAGWGDIGCLMLAKRQSTGVRMAIDGVTFDLTGQGDQIYKIETSKQVYMTYTAKSKSVLKPGE
jgi:hypothetical protein